MSKYSIMDVEDYLMVDSAEVIVEVQLPSAITKVSSNFFPYLTRKQMNLG